MQCIQCNSIVSSAALLELYLASKQPDIVAVKIFQVVPNIIFLLSYCCPTPCVFMMFCIFIFPLIRLSGIKTANLYKIFKNVSTTVSRKS